MSIRSTSLIAVATVLLATPAFAQDRAPAPDSEQIVITAERIRGQVATDLPPVLELDEAEIAAFGADSIADLVAQLAPQVSSGSGRGSGRPVFLVNGQRVSGFREFRRYPPEAIRKVEVLPEEVALQFGFPATQRVINFILKDNFASHELEAEYGGPTRGGYAFGELEASLLTINGPRRFQIGGEFNTNNLLTEDERNIIQTPGSVPGVMRDPDPARFRSLRADIETLEVESTYNIGLGEGPAGGTLSFNANLDREFSRALSGLDAVVLTDAGQSLLRVLDADPLERLGRTTTLELGSSLTKPMGDWQLTATANGTRVWDDTDIERRRDGSGLQALVDAGTLAVDAALPEVARAGFDRASSEVTTATTLATLNGTPVLLPSGEVTVTFDTGYAYTRIESEDSRTGTGLTALDRSDLSAGVNVSVPLTSKREGFLDALGDVSLNLGAGVNDFSDFGTLGDYTAGLRWSPLDRLTLSATYTAAEQAPELNALGAPEIQTFNVPVFDFTTGDTVLATVTTGGNPNLLAEEQRDWKLSASYDLDLFQRANLLFEYFDTRSDNVTAGFPVATPAIEAAFPGRITRDGDGALVAIDRRAVTFAERNSSRIRYGFNLFGRVGTEEPRGEQGGQERGRGQARAGPSAAQRPEGRPDPAQFAALRERFCAAEDLSRFDFSVLPERMLSRLRKEDGTIDIERVATLRERFCSGEGDAGFGVDEEQRAALRTQLCIKPASDTPLDLAALPPAIAERLRAEDGSVDPERLARFRARLCADADAARPTEQRSGGRRGGGSPFNRGDGRGRWFASLYHTVELTSDVLIAPGIPRLDLLDGDALSDTGLSRHRVQLEGGIFHKGLGLRLSGNYLGSARIDDSTNLRFGDLATIDLRAFVNLEQQQWLAGDDPGFLKGMRMAFRVNNVFDAQRRVVDGDGVVPLAFQPGLLDPVGRTVEIEFRKIF